MKNTSKRIHFRVTLQASFENWTLKLETAETLYLNQV